MKLITLMTCAALSLCLAGGATAQGPVRRALRGAGEATADAARVTGQGIRAGVDSVTPDVPAQSRLGGDVDRNASWRRLQHNGDWWYYTPENSWMVYRDNEWTAYSADTFTPNSQYVDSGASQQVVFIDSGGRAVTCQNGRITFVDGAALRSVARSQVNAQGYLIEPGGVSVTTGASAGRIDVNQGAAAQSSVQQSTNGQLRADATGAAVGSDVDAAVQAGAPSISGASTSNSAAPAPASGSATQSTQGAASSAQAPSTIGNAAVSGSVGGGATSGGVDASATGTTSGSTSGGANGNR